MSTVETHPPLEAKRNSAIPGVFEAVFAVTIFSSAALLFVVEPMLGRMILPTFGGAANVWNTCMVFFQAVLLFGYGYAYVITRWLSVPVQVTCHLAVLVTAALTLPMAIGTFDSPANDGSPAVYLLQLLLVSSGLPLLGLTASAPLLQRWFSLVGHARSRDPYFLYAASNAGSLAGLLAYPTFVEVQFTLERQALLWAAGYFGLIALCLTCGVAAYRWQTGEVAAAAVKIRDPRAHTMVGWRDRLRWTALAFVPSSLLLGLTSYLTADVAPVPLLWVIPLAVYLISFVVTFSRLGPRLVMPVRVLLPLVLVLQVYLIVAAAGQSLGFRLGTGLITLMLVATRCHGQLAASRPAPQYLTEFYWWMTVGGFLGGAFNALAAPLLFRSMVELPLMLVLACLLVPPFRQDRSKPRDWMLDLLLPLGLAALAIALLFGSSDNDIDRRFAFPALGALALMNRPLRFALGLGAIVIVGFTFRSAREGVVYADRNFYGALRVTQAADRYEMMHGSTVHGSQRQVRGRERDLPLTYYYPSGPAGQIFEAFFDQPKQRVAVVGLGAGSLASYGEPGQEFTFFEIDPAVIHLASDSPYFTFLGDSPAKIKIVPGDARLSLMQQPDGAFDMLIIDAFSGDAIPTHLLTREALQLYFQKLTPDGLLAMHITNNFVELGPVVAKAAAVLGLAQRAQFDRPTPEELRLGKSFSYWAVIARRPEDLGRLARDPRWRELSMRPGQALWTDDYSNVLGALKGR